MKMDIEIGTGLGDVYFGLTQKALIAKLGVPDQKRIAQDGNALLYYNDIQSVFHFEVSHGRRLGWLESDNPECTLYGKRIFRMSQDRLVAFICREFSVEPEMEDYESFQSYFFDEIWLELQFRFGRLDTVLFGVLFKDDNRVKWPEIPGN